MDKGCSTGAETCPMGSCSLQESCRWECTGTSLVCGGQGQPSPHTLEGAPPYLLSFPAAMLGNVQQTLSLLPGDSMYKKTTISAMTISTSDAMPWWSCQATELGKPKRLWKREGLPRSSPACWGWQSSPRRTILRSPTAPRDLNAPLCPKAILSFI